jgi:SnoaL-like domain
MTNQAAISPTEAADRLAIRELVEAYAHCADRRDAMAQLSLFTADMHFVGSLRYPDAFAKQDGNWLSAERLPYIDCTEERAIS